MTASCGEGALENERSFFERLLTERKGDFTAAFLAVRSLHGIARAHPQTVKPETLDALGKLLLAPEHASQTQAFFLYKEAAGAVASTMVSAPENRLVAHARDTLHAACRRAAGQVHRAVCEALGSVPVRVRGPQAPAFSGSHVPEVDWKGVLARAGVPGDARVSRRGRSYTFPLDHGKRLLVIKMALDGSDGKALAAEVRWMKFLGSGACTFPLRFHVPEPVMVEQCPLFRLLGAPPGPLPGLHPERIAVAFVADGDYFRYIDNPAPESRLDFESFREALLRNALLLGRLASLGLVHTAPIPLFHNRVQAHRRDDAGLYQWQRGGRLDRWLRSCRYPNFGVSGLRDFEHFLSFEGSSQALYRHVGTHFFSLLLVLGAYFRNEAPRLKGWDADGAPVDARHLFRQPLLRDLVEGVFRGYYRGFVGHDPQGGPPVDTDRLASRMIEEMGVDRHMEEVLRASDQESMSEERFHDLLREGGMSEKRIARVEKGRRDITIRTGPHLGGFNDRISLPELTRFAAAAAAWCVSGKHFAERSGQ